MQQSQDLQSENDPRKAYTVVGIYADNFQPFATGVEAFDPDDAIEMARYHIEEGLELYVAGVIEGYHDMVDNMDSDAALISGLS